MSTLNGVETLLGEISFHMPPLSIQDTGQRDKIATENKASIDRVKVVKTFWPETLVKPIRDHYAQWGAQVKGRGFQYAGSLYEYNLSMIDYIEKEIIPVQEETLDVFRGKWIEDYDALREQAKVDMGSLYSDDQFPSKSKVEQSLRFTWNKFAVPQGDYFRRLKGLTEHAAKELEAQQEERYKKHKQESVDDAWKQLVQPIQSLLSSVCKTDDGTRTRFCEDIVDRIKAVAILVPQKLIVSDPQLSAAAHAIHELAGSINVDKLKNNIYARKEFKAQVSQFESAFGRKL